MVLQIFIKLILNCFNSSGIIIIQIEITNTLLSDAQIHLFIHTLILFNQKDLLLSYYMNDTVLKLVAH